MIYMRGQARDYDQWRQLGNQGWGWDDVLPYFRQHEDYVHGADDLHGAGGEWRIDRQRLHWPILDTIRDAAVEAGMPRVTDFNRGDNHGVAYFHVTQRGGIRVNTAKAFLKPVRNRRNLRIVSGAQAKRVLIENGRAVGVEAAGQWHRPGRAGARRSDPRAPARSARRICWSCPASASRSGCAISASTSCMR